MSLSLSQDVKDLRGKVLITANRDVYDWAKKTPLTADYLKKKSKLRELALLMEDFQQPFQNGPYKMALDGWAPNFREWIGELWAPTAVIDELKLVRSRDPYSYQHCVTIAVVGCRLLELWVKAPVTIKKAFLAFLLHDLGKGRIAPTILQKKETLDEAERRCIREHPLASFVLNACYWGEVNHLCAEVALHHHEDRLGSGYPAGIKSNSLILDILTTLDRFDALISERPYRFKAFSPREAFDILKNDADQGKIEPDVLRALVALVRKEKISDLKKIKLGTIGRAAK